MDNVFWPWLAIMACNFACAVWGFWLGRTFAKIEAMFPPQPGPQGER